MSLQIDSLYLVLGLVVLGVALFFVLRRRADRRDESKPCLEQERYTVGDVLTGAPAFQTPLVDALSHEEPDVPTLSKVDSVPEVPETPAYTAVSESPAQVLAKAPAEAPAVAPEVFVDVPKVALMRPELATEVRPLVASEARHRANVDPMLEACMLFTPQVGNFTSEKLNRIGELIESASLPVAVSSDFFDAHVGSWIERSDDVVGCTAVYVSMLLAHRGQASDEVLLSEFLQLGNQIAIAIDAEVELPDVVNALAQVQKLKHLVAQFDNTLALSVRCERAIDMEHLQEICYANGLREDGEKTYVKCEDGCTTPCLKLKVIGEAENVLALEFDIPLCDPARAPLSGFFAFANDLSCALEGVLVDASGNPVGSAAASFIESEVRKLAVAMTRQGVAPGSRRAMRLFAR